MAAFAGGAGDPLTIPKEPGAFVRGASNFQNWVEEDGEFPPEAGRYHLYVNFACGWCHRVLIVRAMKGLESQLPASFTSNAMQGSRAEGTYAGWLFDDDHKDSLHGCRNTLEIYRLGNPDYPNKQLSVPILFDRVTKGVVSNDNIQLGYILNGRFDSLLDEKGRSVDLYPASQREAIDALNIWVYSNLNDGVYRCGFAPDDSELKGKMRDNVFWALDRLEGILKNSEFLVGAEVTLADVRAFPHLFRFDTCYYTAFGCDKSSLAAGYPSIVRWLRQFYGLPGVAGTCNLWDSVEHYHHIKGMPDKARENFEKLKWEWL